MVFTTIVALEAIGSVGTDAVAGKTGAAIVTLVQADGSSAPSTTDGRPYLYRGVCADHPAIDQAKQGVVVPGNVDGVVTPEAHNLGGSAADSPYTSWTRDPDVASCHAAKEGSGGVILRVPTGAPPEGATWSWEPSPDVYGEEEVLMRGSRTGAEVFYQ